MKSHFDILDFCLAIFFFTLLVSGGLVFPNNFSGAGTSQVALVPAGNVRTYNVNTGNPASNQGSYKSSSDKTYGSPTSNYSTTQTKNYGTTGSPASNYSTTQAKNYGNTNNSFGNVGSQDDTEVTLSLYHSVFSATGKSVYTPNPENLESTNPNYMSEEHTFTERFNTSDKPISWSFKDVQVFGSDFATRYGVTKCTREYSQNPAQLDKKTGEKDVCEGPRADNVSYMETYNYPDLLTKGLSVNSRGTDTSTGTDYGMNESIETFTLTTDSSLFLLAKGKPNKSYPVTLSVGANRWSLSREGNPRGLVNGRDVNCTSITVAGKRADQNCRVTVSALSGRAIDVTPKVQGVSRYTYIVRIVW